MAASPPNGSLRSDGYGKSDPQMYGYHAERQGMDRPGPNPLPSLSTSISDPSTLSHDSRTGSILIRKLPRGTKGDTVESMLIFASDLLDIQLVQSPYTEDNGFATAVARFRSEAGAIDAQQKLDGKPNTAKDANMIVELSRSSMVGSFERRNTTDGAASRTQNSSASSAASISGPPSSRSRFGSAFQSSEKVSPPLPTPNSGSSAEFPVPENSAHFQNLFSPQSPLANGVRDHRVSGKSMINDDSADDETGELLKDPVAYARSGQQPFAHRPSNPQALANRLGSLSLSTGNGSAGNLGSPPASGVTSPRNAASLQSPTSAISPTSVNYAGGNGFLSPNNPKPQYPPVNPADQNPPCNTLYVGNLPIDTSEDELKAIFSRQRGYKRLCFRTKQNGPMCFVEFEDVAFATRALNDLYGHPLHNSVKGGIRLSFSKNPLGVRSGGPTVPNGMMSMPHPPPGYGGMVNGHTFSGVSGPPPGLGTPPGMVSPNGFRPQPAASMDGMFANPFSVPIHEFADQLGPRTTLSGGVPPQIGSGSFSRDNGYADARDSRNGHPSVMSSGRNGFADYATEGHQGYTDRTMGR